MSVEKSGKSHKDAQRMCAIKYYKEHGRTPAQDDEKAAKETKAEGSEEIYESYELQLFKALDVVGPFFVDKD